MSRFSVASAASAILIGCLAASATLALPVPPLFGGGPFGHRRDRDQDQAYEAMRAGQIRPLREIEGRVVPRMGGARYLGPEILDDGRYRLKFLRGDSVIWVDVDGRTGAILGRTGD